SGPPPVALLGRRAVASTLERLDDFQLPPGAALARTLPAAEPDDELAAFVQRSLRSACATADRLAEVARSEDPAARYPGSALAGQLRLVARLLKAGLGTRVFYTRQGGYDTHSNQIYTHANLLATLGGAVKAFLDDLKAAKLADRVAVLMFSEFGRTVKENGS